jgi:ABC-type bacteriocin/lantibiotic exporter with double-glycine peptidase domain
VEGVDLAQVDPAWLRRQVGVVLQENFFFNCSVRDYIALTDPGLVMEQVIQAANRAEAHELYSGIAGRLRHDGGRVTNGLSAVARARGNLVNALFQLNAARVNLARSTRSLNTLN